MGEFIRARSAAQKDQRMAEIKAAARSQFETRPYHEITLTTIAEDLAWSRANLYKYVCTKEEIFLALAADERDSYYAALLAALPEGCGFSREIVAEVWAGIVAAHAAWFRLHDLLFTIIETNVSVERLMEFKRGYYEQVDGMAARLESVAGVPRERFERLMNAVSYHAAGIFANCCDTPKVAEALERLGVERAPLDQRAEMREFIAMCLERWGA